MKKTKVIYQATIEDGYVKIINKPENVSVSHGLPDKGGPASATPGGKKCCGPDFAGYVHPDTKLHLY